jgi:hypothetical protein
MDFARPDIIEAGYDRLFFKIPKREQITKSQTTYLGIRDGDFSASSRRLSPRERSLDAVDYITPRSIHAPYRRLENRSRGGEREAGLQAKRCGNRRIESGRFQLGGCGKAM